MKGFGYRSLEALIGAGEQFLDPVSDARTWASTSIILHGSPRRPHLGLGNPNIVKIT